MHEMGLRLLDGGETEALQAILNQTISETSA
jgi:hypothetical protein